MARVKMLSGQYADAVFWSEKAMTLTADSEDGQTLSEALNAMGAAQMQLPAYHQTGVDNLQQSLDIALKNGYHEQAARAYASFGNAGVTLKDHELAKANLQAGIQFCEEKHLDIWAAYMLAVKARLLFETGCYNEACSIAGNLLTNETQSGIIKINALVVLATVNMRKGNTDAGAQLLQAGAMVTQTTNLQQVLLVLTAQLEYEWLTGIRLIEKPLLDFAVNEMKRGCILPASNLFGRWLLQIKQQGDVFFKDYEICIATINPIKGKCDVEHSPYEHAFHLLDGDNAAKKTGISLIRGLGASAVYEDITFAEGRKAEQRDSRQTFYIGQNGRPSYFVDINQAGYQFEGEGGKRGYAAKNNKLDILI
jgi:tetratricopeptide (TPR) repeat protein